MRRAVSGVALAMVIGLTLASGGCVRYQSLDGVENTWSDLATDRLQIGTTTEADILDWLGPPSQIVALGDSRVFYYLSQKQSGKARVFILWNEANDQTRYDRAVFFFGPDGVMTEYSIRDEATAGG